jgi:hypothetical protein
MKKAWCLKKGKCHAMSMGKKKHEKTGPEKEIHERKSGRKILEREGSDAEEMGRPKITTK